MRFVSFLLHKSLDKVNFYTGLIVPFKIKTTGTTVGPCFVSYNEEITSTSTKTLLFFRTMTWTLITHTPESYSKHYISSTFPPFSTQECIFLRKSLSRQRLESLIVVAYVDSVISRSGRHLSIHAAPRWRSGVIL
jgi:hypothetical protein